jgi:hypothetical protein
LHVGRGYHALGNSMGAIPYLERAIEMASTHKLNQLMFEAESALSDVKRAVPVSRPRAPMVLDSAVQDVVYAIHQMKETAGVA